MDAAAFDELVRSLRSHAGLAAKADIGEVVARLGLSGAPIAVGDDCAAIPDREGHLLFAIEGFISEFVAADPWFAGWCGVMVNVSDIAAMGGRPIAVVDAIWSNGAGGACGVLEGMKAASDAYGVPIVGGHTNLRSQVSQLAVAVLGRAGASLLTSFDAKPGEKLVAAIDHRGRYRETFSNWQTALEAPASRLRADLELLPRIAERELSRAAKDISQAGLAGTAIMLAESSGVAIDLDLDAIKPPPAVSLSRWLRSFPSFGFLLSVEQGCCREVLSMFDARDIHAAIVGEIREGCEVTVNAGGRRAVLRDFGVDRLMGLGALVGDLA